MEMMAVCAPCIVAVVAWWDPGRRAGSWRRKRVTFSSGVLVGDVMELSDDGEGFVAGRYCGHQHHPEKPDRDAHGDKEPDRVVGHSPR